MKEKYEDSFERYFFIDAPVKVQKVKAFFETSREEKIIIPEQIFFDNRKFPYQNRENKPALIVSCGELYEFTGSDLLLEPYSHNLSYYVLAMKNANINPGNVVLLADALRLMSKCASEGKQIILHYDAQINHPVMLTSLFFAYRYLLGDKSVRTNLNKAAATTSRTLVEGDDNFISQLYKVACIYVGAKCLSFHYNIDVEHKLALATLKLLIQEILNKPPKHHDCNFLNQFIQSTAFKKLHHNFYSQSEELQNCVKQFFNDFLNNKKGWYQQLNHALSDEEEFEKEPLFIFCHPRCINLIPKEQASIGKRRDLIKNLLATINVIAHKFPQATHSLQVLKAQEFLNASNFAAVLIKQK